LRNRVPIAGYGANLVEIFSSVQGEGVHVGATTLFVRFGECDLRCRWCDSPHTWKAASECRVEAGRGSGKVRAQPNPMSLEDIVAAAEMLELRTHEFVSLTGGEPLLQPDAARAIARELRGCGPRILLETHGLGWQKLETVIEFIDVVSMDWKLTSDVRRASDPRRGPIESFHDDHERFLKVARNAPELMVKLVVTDSSGDDEIEEMAARIARSAPEAWLVLQPVTPSGPVSRVPAPERLLALCARLSSRLARVRLIPQTHKIYGAP
jgi:7-carboxy-7-deazaguanine synthase